MAKQKKTSRKTTVKKVLAKKVETKKASPKNLSLFSDYNKETTVPGLGFKDKEKALYTIEKIKHKSFSNRALLCFVFSPSEIFRSTTYI